MNVLIAGLSPCRPDMDLDHLLDNEWEIWALPWDHPDVVKKATRFFELHPREAVEHPDAARGRRYIDLLAMLGNEPDARHHGSIYVQDVRHWASIPGAVDYPLNEIIRELGRDYFGSSIAYMIALAIFERANHISIWGVQLADPVYDHQRPNLEWMIGFAEARGMVVEIVPPSQLLKHRTVDRIAHLPMIYPKRYGWT